MFCTCRCRWLLSCYCRVIVVVAAGYFWFIVVSVVGQCWLLLATVVGNCCWLLLLALLVIIVASAVDYCC